MCTNEHAYHWSQDGNHCCVACGLPDSLHHRLWTCCRSGDLRASFTPEALDIVASLPTVVSCRGWFLRSCLFEPWVIVSACLPSFRLQRVLWMDSPFWICSRMALVSIPGLWPFVWLPGLSAWLVHALSVMVLSLVMSLQHHLWMASRKQHFVPSLKLLLRPSLTLELKSVGGLIAKGLSTSFFCCGGWPTSSSANKP